jgi:hypothetical protein
MADFSCASTKQTSHWRFRVILAAAAFALSLFRHRWPP